MPAFLPRLTCIAALIACLGSVSAAEPATRPLTARETLALRVPLDLGYRLHDALYRYFTRDRPPLRLQSGVDVVTGWPTPEVLHAIGYIADSDMPLIRRYRVSIATATFKLTDPVLTMQTRLGEIRFDARGDIALRPPP
jgi:hypothetical protein